MKRSGRCISQDALEGRINLDQSIEVRDGNGEVVHDVRFADAVIIDPIK